MRPIQLLGLVVSAIVLSACGSLGELASIFPTDGSGGGPDLPSTGSAPTPVGQLTPPPQAITCEILPVADVDSLSPFDTAMVNFEDTGGCHYYPDVETEQRPASVDSVVEVLYSPEEAVEALAFEREQLSNPELEYRLADVSGAGDQAFSYVDRIGDESGIRAISGQFLIKVALRGEFQDNQGPDVSSQAKLDSAADMINLVITRLP